MLQFTAGTCPNSITLIPTFAAIPPTNILLGMIVPYFGAWPPDNGVELGVVTGEPSAED